MTTLASVTPQPASSAASDEPAQEPDSPDSRSLTDASEPQGTETATVVAPEQSREGLSRASPATTQTRAWLAPTVVVSMVAALIGALVLAAVTGFNALLSEFDALRADMAAMETSLRAEIARVEDSLRAEIASGDASLRAEISMFRAEMSMFRSEVNATLLDHTDRLARLEALHLAPGGTHG